MTKIETDGIIQQVEVTITVEAPEEHEHLAELIHSDLTTRADEINQIAELGKHPDATNPKANVDWEGWHDGDYDD